MRATKTEDLILKMTIDIRVINPVEMDYVCQIMPEESRHGVSSEQQIAKIQDTHVA